MPPRRSKTVAKVSKGKAAPAAKVNTGTTAQATKVNKDKTAQAAKDNSNQLEEEDEDEEGKEKEEQEEADQEEEDREEEDEEESGDKQTALDTKENRKQLRDIFDARMKALNRLPKDGSKGDKKRQLLYERATDIIQNGQLRSNPCSNCETANKECFVAPSDWRGADLGPGKCALCVWGGTPCSLMSNTPASKTTGSNVTQEPGPAAGPAARLAANPAAGPAAEPVLGRPSLFGSQLNNPFGGLTSGSGAMFGSMGPSGMGFGGTGFGGTGFGGMPFSGTPDPMSRILALERQLQVLDAGLRGLLPQFESRIIALENELSELREPSRKKTKM